MDDWFSHNVRAFFYVKELKYMKIFLTGQKQIGKSTCIRECVEECHVSICGFQTLPYMVDGKRMGFYLHALHDMDQKDVLFSKQHETWNEVIPNVFDTYGVSLLEKASTYTDHVMILDEIGHLERNDELYVEKLLEVVDKFPNILGVLKKYEIQYIRRIASREDVVVLDLDTLSYEDAKEFIIKELEEVK